MSDEKEHSGVIVGQYQAPDGRKIAEVCHEDGSDHSFHELVPREEMLGHDRMRPMEDADGKVRLYTRSQLTRKLMATTGPGQVASPGYRDGWDRIFGGNKPS